MKNLALPLMLAASMAAFPAHQAQAGLAKKVFVVGSLIAGGVALSKAQATQHCAANPSDPQCAKHVKGTDADPAIVSPKVAATPGAPAATPAAPGVAGAPRPAKDPNAMIDAGAAKAKTTVAKFSAWLGKKKEERAAKKAAAGTVGAVPAPAPVPAQ